MFNRKTGAQIAKWVKGGGVLVILANDPANTDLERFNLIADRVWHSLQQRSAQARAGRFL